MTVALLGGIGTFTACWVIHLAIWRIHRPSGYLIWLSLLFFGLPLAVLVGGRLLGVAAIQAIDLTAPTVYAAAVLHVILSCCYTCGYAGITEYSPSAEVLLAVREHMPDGIAPESLRVASFTEYSLTGKRIEHLVHSKLIEIVDQQVRLTPSGQFAVAVCRNYRKFLGVDEVGHG